MSEKERVTEELYLHAVSKLELIKNDRRDYENAWIRVIIGIIWLNQSIFENIIKKYYPNNDYDWSKKDDVTYNRKITSETTGEQIYDELDYISANRPIYDNDIIQIIRYYTKLYDVNRGTKYITYVIKSLKSELKKRNSAVFFSELTKLPWIVDDVTCIKSEVPIVPVGKKKLSSVLKYAQNMKKQLILEKESNYISDYDFLMKKKAIARGYSSAQIDDIYEYYLSWRGVVSADDENVINNKNTKTIDEVVISESTYELVYDYIDFFIENECDDVQKIIMSRYMDNSAISTQNSTVSISYRDYFLSRYDEKDCMGLKELSDYLTMEFNAHYDSTGVKRIYSRCIQKMRYVLPK